jgi:hypothetical protein
MTDFRGSCVILLVAASMLTAPWWTAAAPYLPARGRPSDEALSLERVRSIRLEVDALPEPLTDAGANSHAYRELLRKELEDSHFVIGEGNDLPLLKSRVMIAEDDEHPDMMAIHHVIALRQKVLVDRLEKRLFVPTASISHVVLASHQDAVTKLNRLVRQNVRAFKSTVESATIVQKTP